MFVGDKFTPELPLRHAEFTYSACEPFSKHCERIRKFKETDDLNYICKNSLGKACFTNDATYANSRYLAKKTISYKVLTDAAYEIVINPKYGRYQTGLVTMVYNFFFDK